MPRAFIYIYLNIYFYIYVYIFGERVPKELFRDGVLLEWLPGHLHSLCRSESGVNRSDRIRIIIKITINGSNKINL